jgi:uncharacterized protein YciI
MKLSQPVARRVAATSSVTFFIVHYFHYNLELWQRHLAAHVDYLKQAVSVGILRASGPFCETGKPSREGLLIFACPDRDALIASIVTDPFHIHGVVDEMSITVWDPVFGCFSSESSGNV